MPTIFSWHPEDKDALWYEPPPKDGDFVLVNVRDDLFLAYMFEGRPEQTRCDGEFLSVGTVVEKAAKKRRGR